MSKYIWTDDELNYLIDNYSKGVSAYKIMDDLNISRSTVYRKIKELNLDYHIKEWSSEGIKYLIDNYDLKSNVELAKDLNRKVADIELKAGKLGLHKSKKTISKIKQKWSDEDIKFLKEFYRILSVADIAMYLNKTKGCINQMAGYYGLRESKPQSATKTRKPWTDEEIEYIKANYLTMEQKTIARKLNRTLESIQKKMEYLGLKKYDRKDNWNNKDVEYLKIHYANTPMNVMQEHLKIRSIDAIKGKAISLELNRDIQDTYIEKEIENILKSLNVEYKKQVRVGKYIVDFLLEDKKAIEADGDYWHCNPRIYKEPKTECQRHNIEKDIRKNKFLKDKGFEVLRIWEYDLNHNYDECLQAIIGYCRLESKLQKIQDY